MARKTGGRTRTPSTTPTRRQARDTSLIDWDEPVRNAHVLDWRGRAREFGLLPAGDGDTDDAVVAAATPPERLLEEEEPEAFDEQPIAASGADGEPGDASDEGEDEGPYRAEAVEDRLVAGEVGTGGEVRGKRRVVDPVDLEREEDERRGEGGDPVLRVGQELRALGIGGVLVVAQARVGHDAARHRVDPFVALHAVEHPGGVERGKLALVVVREGGAGVPTGTL